MTLESFRPNAEATRPEAPRSNAEAALQPDARNQNRTISPSVMAPFFVLCLLVAFLPASMPAHSSGVSSEECLTLADTPAAGKPLSLLERCHAFYPRDVELLADLGTAYERVDVSRAEHAYRQALELDPGYAELRLRLGRLLLRRGAAAEAVREAEAALRVQPNRQALVALLNEARATAAR